MEFYDAIGERRSVRSFSDEAIPPAALGRVLEAARRAPSASNKQPWRLVVVADRAKREAIAASGTYGKFLAQSPLAIVGVGDPVLAPKWHAVDTAIALEHVVLAATAEGLGSCWVGSFDEARVKELLGVPEAMKVVAVVALGYPKRAPDLVGAANKVLRPGKGLGELVGGEDYATNWAG